MSDGCKIPMPQANRVEELSRLQFLANKVKKVHGKVQLEMVTLNSLLYDLNETNISPVLKEKAEEVEVLTKSFTPWDGACGSVVSLFSGLKEFVK